MIVRTRGIRKKVFPVFFEKIKPEMEKFDKVQAAEEAFIGVVDFDLS
jgi:hypothetical protein